MRELRMYGLVPYNISPIQQGIQYGHAVVEYERTFGDTELYKDWSSRWKTFIILNGGTTNKKIIDGVPYGTLNQHLLTLKENGIDFECFYEPDLGDQLTSIVFLVDERAFNKEDYPDFDKWVINKFGTFLNKEQILDLVSSNDVVYEEWVKLVGEKNAFLKDFLKQFRLA
jgi:hypothetical protein